MENLIKVVKPSVQIISESNLYTKIESVGRTCYKSEDKITEKSAKPFVERLINAGHWAMLEHYYYVWKLDPIGKLGSKFLEVYYNLMVDDDTSFWAKYLRVTAVNNRIIVSYNIRTSLESTGIIENLMKCYNFSEITNSDWVETEASAIERYYHKYVSMRIICDRGVSHEIVRHREFSFAQESTRYVNYKNKTAEFVVPADYNSWTSVQKGLFLSGCATSIDNYKSMIESGLKPQQARATLVNAIKTEICVTGNEKEWLHFFELRCAPSAHPDMQVIANLAKEQYNTTVLNPQNKIE